MARGRSSRSTGSRTRDYHELFYRDARHAVATIAATAPRVLMDVMRALAAGGWWR